ncbi:hypothetical protein TWF192_007293 [Orbilia oligospora]|uniref:Clr5 domain-containing protein n=1 Tax=Orbilia oligospora TaxID=2813651 RepID=A0A6G1M4V9_ORBOL|nr:hypothetical protein TWF191_005856 [Orbilia oligospora]KAF3245817.1 hypothetical protein TWF192_007293 [Orbilia oligospora]
MPHDPPTDHVIRVGADVWEQHKDVILRLRANHTVDQIAKIMWENTGFFATKSQYNDQLLRVWKAKKNFSAKDHEFLNQQFEQRDAMGKTTRVKRNGINLSEENVRRRSSRQFVTVFERHKKKQAAKAENHVDSGIENRDFEVGSPSESGNSPRSPAPDAPDSMETNLPDASTGCLEVDETTSPNRNWDYYHPYVEDAEDVEFSSRYTLHYNHPIEELQKQVIDGLKKVPLAADDIGVLGLQTDEPVHQDTLIGLFIDDPPFYLSPDDITWEIYACQKEPDRQEYIKMRRQEAMQWIESAQSLSDLEAPGDFNPDMMDQTWMCLERDTNYEPLPHRVCQQILEVRQLGNIESREMDHEWCISMSTLLKNNFTEMKLYTENVLPIREEYAIPVEGPQYNPDIHQASIFEYNTFDSVAIHLPTFISEFGINHFFTAFALQEAARYLCFSQQRSEPRTLSLIMPGTNQSSPAQRYPAITSILTQALISYENIGMGDHPLAIECLEMLLSNTDEFDDEDPISGFLTTEVSGIPYRNFQRSYEKYGSHHPQTISAYAQLISFTLKLLKSPKARAQLASGTAQRVTTWGWNFEKSIEAVFNPCFDSFLIYDLGGKKTTKRPNSKARWQHIVRGNMFDILQTFEDTNNFDNAIRLLNKMKRWNNAQSGWLEQDGFQINLTLGRIYGKMEAYKASLKTLFDLADGANRPESRDWAWDAVREITVVTTRRGPVLYRCIQPFLQKLLNTWERSGRRRNYCYSTLVAIFSINRGRPDSLSALKSLERVSPSDLQDQVCLGEPDIPMPNSGSFKFGDYVVWRNSNLDPYSGLIN